MIGLTAAFFAYFHITYFDFQFSGIQTRIGMMEGVKLDHCAAYWVFHILEWIIILVSTDKFKS